MAGVLLMGTRISGSFRTTVSKSRVWTWWYRDSVRVLFYPKRFYCKTNYGSGRQINCFSKTWPFVAPTRFLFRKLSTNGNAVATKQPVRRTPSASELKRLISLVKPEARKVTVAVSLLFVSSAVAMSVPFCMGRVLDVIYAAQEQGEMVKQLSLLCKVFVAIFVIGAVANFGRVVLIQISGQRIINSLREKIFGAVLRQEMAFFDQRRTGELINRLSADTSLVGQALTGNISDGLRALAQISVGISMMVQVFCSLTISHIL